MTIVAGVAVGLVASMLFAQTVDLASMSAQYMPGAQMADAPGKVQVASYDVAANAPIPLAPKSFLIPGVGYHVDAVSFENTPPEFIQLRAFQSIDVSTLFVQMLGGGWSVATRASLGLAGDFQAVDSRMLRANALATASYSFSKRFVLGAGALTSFSFGSFLPLPAIYVDWKPFDGAEIEAFVPAFVHARYTFFHRLRVGVIAELSGNEYAVRDPRIRDACVRPEECFDNLAYSVGNGGLAVGVRLFSSVWFTGVVGHSFFRRLDRRNAARDLLPEGRSDIPNVLVVRAGLVWRLPNVD